MSSIEIELMQESILDLRSELAELKARSAEFLAHIASKVESDSTVGSCDCLTKTPDIEYHKPGCRYRLIVERNAYKQDRDDMLEALNKIANITKSKDSNASDAGK